jgi:hypothetical protein
MIYDLIIVKTIKKSLVLDYELSNATFKPLNHVVTHMRNHMWNKYYKFHKGLISFQLFWNIFSFFNT